MGTIHKTGFGTKEYTILHEENNPHGLCQKVEKYMKDGWVPVGGIHTDQWYRRGGGSRFFKNWFCHNYYQAMMRIK